MGASVGRKGRLLLSLATAAALSSLALILAKCGEEPGSHLIGNGEAWIDNAIGVTGYVFKDCGKVLLLSAATMNAESWVISAESDYHIDGGNVTIAGMPYAFSVSGTTLTLKLTVSGITSSVKYTKKGDIRIVPMEKEVRFAGKTH